MHFVKRNKPPRIIYFMILFIWLWKRQNSTDNRVVVQALGVGAGLVTKEQHKIIWGEERELFCILIEVVTAGLYCPIHSCISPTHTHKKYEFSVYYFLKPTVWYSYCMSIQRAKIKKLSNTKVLKHFLCKIFHFSKTVWQFLGKLSTFLLYEQQFHLH